MVKINQEEFTWFLPSPKSDLSINIPNSNRLNLNNKLVDKMPAYITLGISLDGTKIFIKEHGEDGFKVIKSGSIKAHEFISALTKCGVHLPARYIVTKTDGGWIATLTSPVLSRVNKTTAKPRKQNLSPLIESGDKNT
ncbi:MAG: hypothetical protein EOM14_02390 [Clostridia bacterium]|nr:hypothetical protein [Clostridia bacterium]